MNYDLKLQSMVKLIQHSRLIRSYLIRNFIDARLGILKFEIIISESDCIVS